MILKKSISVMMILSLLTIAAASAEGIFYRDPRGVPSIEELIAEIQELTIEDPAEMHTQGDNYAHGIGVELNYEKAMEWYLQAAELGYAASQCSIGYLYEHGYGVEMNYSEAMTWYLKAAENGSNIAMDNIGLMYHYGRGVAVDLVKAEEYYRMAIDAGYSEAQQHLDLVLAQK